MTLSLRYAARSDVGLVREGNEDSGYAGPSLLAVADGMGGHAAGEVASSVTVATLAVLEDDVPSTELVEALAAVVNDANLAINEMVERHPQLDGMGTTLTALLWSGRRVGLVHIGDSRAYLLRDGRFEQITHDHTFVQQLQDEGRITAAEAAVHPQRSLLLRALDGRSNPEPDLSVREVQLGDRYLLCSDGLSAVVSDIELGVALANPDLEETADSLIQLALRGGAPDNVTAIVADVVEVDANPSEHPVVVGAAAGAPKPAAAGSTSEIDLSAVAAPAKTRAGRGSRILVRALIVAVIAALIGGGWAGYAWSQRQYYVGANAGQVAIYKGLSQQIIGISLSEPYERQDIAVSDLPPLNQQEVLETIFADSLAEAKKVVDRLRAAATECQQQKIAEEQARPAPAPTSASTPTPAATLPPLSSGPPGVSPEPDSNPAVGALAEASPAASGRPETSASSNPTGIVAVDPDACGTQVGSG